MCPGCGKMSPDEQAGACRKRIPAGGRCLSIAGRYRDSKSKRIESGQSQNVHLRCRLRQKVS